MTIVSDINFLVTGASKKQGSVSKTMPIDAWKTKPELRLVYSCQESLQLEEHFVVQVKRRKTFFVMPVASIQLHQKRLNVERHSCRP